MAANKLWSLALLALAPLLGCSSNSPERGASAKLPIIQLEPKTTLQTGAPSTRARTCPGHRLPDQCGGWAGVELVATSAEHNGSHSDHDDDDHHCHHHSHH